MSSTRSTGRLSALWNRRGVRLVAGVVGLAIVISIGSALAVSLNAGKVDEPSNIVLPSPEAQSQTLYQQAVQAQASGDTTRAVVLLGSAVKANPSNTQAKTLLAKITPKPVAVVKPPAGGAASSPATSSTGDALYAGAVADVSSLLPKAVKGYAVAGLIPADAADVEAPYEPSKDTSYAGKVPLMVIGVHDFGSPAAASAFVDGAGKAYPKDVASVKVGRLVGKYGHDGRRLASVSFARGRFAFEVTLTTSDGDPAAYKSEVLRIAALIPAALP